MAYSFIKQGSLENFTSSLENQEISIMKQKLIGVLAVMLASLSFSAVAEDCSWNTTGFQFSGSSTTVSFACRDGSTLAATKQVTVTAKHTSCSISVASNYENSGSCNSPNIIDEPACRIVTPSGGSCNDWWCAERFGRNCAALGGSTSNGPNFTCTVCN